MPTFVNRPVKVEAIQWKGDNFTELFTFMKLNSDICCKFKKGPMVIHIKEKIMDVKVGDWILKDVVGEFYPVDKKVFELTYRKLK